jgi:hypothetical protein
LQNHLSNINDLAQKPIGYRYTITQLIYEQIQHLTELSGSHLRSDQANRDARRRAVLPATCRPWQARVVAVFEPRQPSAFARTREFLKEIGQRELRS